MKNKKSSLNYSGLIKKSADCLIFTIVVSLRCELHLILSLVGAATVLALCSGALFVSGVVFGKWEAGVLMDAIIFPLCLWTVASWMTVLRFLFYMNSRIRSEGWEIELRFKAEAERLKETLA